MFDLTSSKLLILGIVALLVVGPKELPLLLRTIGKYTGMIRRHAAEFRSQFDEAMREQELASLKAEMDAVKRDVEATVNTAGSAIENDVVAATRDIEHQIKAPDALAPSHDVPEPTPAAQSSPEAGAGDAFTHAAAQIEAAEAADAGHVPDRVPDHVPAKVGA